MGRPSAPGPTPEELEAQRLQNERLQNELDAAERQKKEANALMKARRGGAGSLLTGSESGTNSGYSSILG